MTATALPAMRAACLCALDAPRPRSAQDPLLAFAIALRACARLLFCSWLFSVRFTAALFREYERNAFARHGIDVYSARVLNCPYSAVFFGLHMSVEPRAISGGCASSAVWGAFRAHFSILWWLFCSCMRLWQFVDDLFSAQLSCLGRKRSHRLCEQHLESLARLLVKVESVERERVPVDLLAQLGYFRSCGAIAGVRERLFVGLRHGLGSQKTRKTLPIVITPVFGDTLAAYRHHITVGIDFAAFSSACEWIIPANDVRPRFTIGFDGEAIVFPSKNIAVGSNNAVQWAIHFRFLASYSRPVSCCGESASGSALLASATGWGLDFSNRKWDHVAGRENDAGVATIGRRDGFANDAQSAIDRCRDQFVFVIACLDDIGTVKAARAIADAQSVVAHLSSPPVFASRLAMSRQSRHGCRVRRD